MILIGNKILIKVRTKMATYKDIAKVVGVSKTTVSHAINKTRYVAPATIKKIEKAIKDLNYKPNWVARSLVTGKTHTIGLVISDIMNPDYSGLIKSIEMLANEKDYNIFLCDTNFDIEIGIKSITAFISKQVDGIIVVMSQANMLIIEELKDSGIPFVILDSDQKDVDYDFTYIDFKPGIFEAIDYLVSLDHKKIYFIMGPTALKTSRKRKKIFIDGIERYKNIDYKIFEGDHNLEGGIKAVNEIIDSKEIPSAIICSNDFSASGASRELIRSGYHIPEDISIIGIDNCNLLCTLAIPSLTSVDIYRFNTGKWAFEMLMNRIKDKKRPVQKKIIKTKLILRDSVCRVK